MKWHPIFLRTIRWIQNMTRSSNRLEYYRPGGEKTYSQSLAETRKMSNEEIQESIKHRESIGKATGILHRVLADRSDEKAKRLNIDPPRPGRKTYSERYAETSMMSRGEIRAKIAERRAMGKEVGVLERVLSERE